MISRIVLLIFIIFPILALPQLTANIVSNLPVKVSNNSVCEGFINNQPFIYSFAGIDSTKTHNGIHLKSFRYDVMNNQTMTLPNLPDTMGKIATAANRIGDIIYITGGYHVLASGNEISSNKIHRFDVLNNTFLSDGPNIPHATDDHVQIVWRDSLLVLITGWKNTGNIPNVQIYNPSLNTWSVGTAVPNNNIYKSFGASGVVLDDTIYYYGGASSGAGFNAQNVIRKGIINPTNPTDINWSYTQIDPTVKGYRMAATTIGNTLHWIGGSNITYNYNGIAYNGSGGVPNNNRDLYTNSELSLWWESSITPEIPMDLRGIANINDSVKYIIGGMIDNQEVTNKIYKLVWDYSVLNVKQHHYLNDMVIYPNPSKSVISIKNIDLNSTVTIYNCLGNIMLVEQVNHSNSKINILNLPTGMYFVKIQSENSIITKQLIKN